MNQMQLDRRLFFLLHRAHRALTVHGNALTQRELGLSVSQLATLQYVSKNPGCSLTALADLLDLNKSAVTGLVQRMERAGTLRRTPDARDGRAQLLFVTPKGERAREASRRLVQKLNAELTAGFSEAEIDTVLRFLNAVLERTGG